VATVLKRLWTPPQGARSSLRLTSLKNSPGGGGRRGRYKGEWWIYLIYCKNFCESHNVPPTQYNKKELVKIKNRKTKK
jgi:hypothetical protein